MSATETMLCPCGSDLEIIPSLGWCLSCQFSERNTQTYTKCKACGFVNVRSLAHQGFEPVNETHNGTDVQHEIALYQCQQCNERWAE